MSAGVAYPIYTTPPQLTGASAVFSKHLLRNLRRRSVNGPAYPRVIQRGRLVFKLSAPQRRTNCACAGRKRSPVRMLQITSQKVKETGVNVTYAKPYLRTFYANDVNDGKKYAGTPSILNTGCASYSRGNITPDLRLRKLRK